MIDGTHVDVGPPTAVFVCSHFFPHQHVAAVRVTAFACGLADRGWNVGVLTLRRSSEDASSDVGGPDHDILVRHVAPVPALVRERRYGARSLAQRLDAFLVRAGTALSSPDRWSRLWRRSETDFAQAATDLRPDVVVTTSPPHSIHSVGRMLKGRLGVPWVADVRDPLEGDHRFVPVATYLLTPWRPRRYARSVYRGADAVTHALPQYHRWVRERYPEARTVLVPNGVPDDHADVLDAAAPSVVPGRVVLVGKVTGEQLELVAAGVAAARQRRPEAHLVVVGEVPPRAAIATDALLGDSATLLGRVSHARSLSAIRQADVLVKALSDDRGRAPGLTSTLYEMLATDRHVVIINPREEDRAVIAGLVGVTALTSPERSEVASALAAVLQDQAGAAGRGADFREQHRRSLGVDRLDHLLRSLIDLDVRSAHRDRDRGPA